MEKNRDLEQLSRTQLQDLAIQDGRQRNLSRQAVTTQQNQRNPQQMGAHEHATLQMQQDFAQMRERNRNRTEFTAQKPSSVSTTNRTTQPAAEPIPTRPDGNAGPAFDPWQATNGATPDANQAPNRNHGDYSPFQAPTNSVQGLTPMPCVGFPNMAVDSRPAFTPHTCQNWKGGIKLRIA